jgi:outer membrane receptor protein involved in Fe transport
MFVRLNPNPDFDSEVLTALELGWVSQWRPWLSWTVAAFRNSHDRVLSLELGPPFAESDADGRRVIVPVSFGNGLTGHSTGIEVTTQIQPRPWWRTTASYSHLSMSIAARPDSRDAGLVERSNGITPRHQLQVVTTLRPSSSVTATWFLRAIGEVPAVNVPAYTTSRLHVEWQVRPNASLFVTGRNLHHASHVEFEDGRNGTTGIRRSFMAGVRWER